jgi:uncharacterized membrane protein YbaN (DUF454 family)
MKNHVKKIAILVTGWFFILLGIVGLFLPILQGILFIAIGLLILSRESPWAKKILVKLRRRYPEQYKKLDKFRQKFSSLFKK